MKKDIKKRIEENIASGGRFDRNKDLPTYLNDTEAGLQVALSDMEIDEGNLNLEQGVAFHGEVKRISEEFYEAGIPLESVTNPDGLKKAIQNSYERIGFPDKSSYWPTSKLDGTKEVYKEVPKTSDLDNLSPYISN